MDILLKPEQLVLEVKYARAGHAAREITDELLIDIGRYRSHPDCKALVCFVYDPHHVLKNAAELERDLSGDEKVVVRVVVRPK